MNTSRFRPIAVSLNSVGSPRAALRTLSFLPYCLLLESSLRKGELGRYSFLAFDPIDVEIVPLDAPRPFEKVQRILETYSTPAVAELPPFQGGWAGLLSYELGRSFERLPKIQSGAIDLPALVLGLYDVVIAWDHLLNESWIISQGLPETQPDLRLERAQRRVDQVQEWLSEGSAKSVDSRQMTSGVQTASIPVGFKRFNELCLSNFTEQEYLSAIKRARDYVNAGEIFQTNLSQQLLLPAKGTSLDLYDDLATTNASPFSGYFDLGNCQIISSSPERLVQIKNRALESRPIKGTRRRTKIPMVDISVARELETNEKERAENTMIVDLMRNDFSRICTDESVVVSEWCTVESYETVFHLVSAIDGKLREGVDATDVIAAVFPGGSVTGAPKIRAMEIISELEQVSRGAYCGSLGYFGLSGDADFNILIRTITAQGGWWQLPVGGAIVSQSIPEQEYAETWTKAAAVLRACLNRLDQVASPSPEAPDVAFEAPLRNVVAGEFR